MDGQMRTSYGFIVVMSSLAGAAVGEDKSLPANELICGPRCASFIVNNLGGSLSVCQAVQRLQWPDVSAGCTMSALQDLFRDQGLNTKAIAFGIDEILEVSGPAVVAIQKGHDLDHFVVVLTSTPQGQVTYWDGLTGVQTESSSLFWSRAQRQVLLISSGVPTVKRDSTWHPGNFFNGILIVGGSLVLALTVGRRLLPSSFLRRSTHVA